MGPPKWVKTKKTMNDQMIDNIIKQLKSLKTSKNEKISKALLRKWDDCEDVNAVKKLPVKELRALCNHFDIKASGEKTMLANRLWEYWEANCSDTEDETDDESETDDEDETDDESDEE